MKKRLISAVIAASLMGSTLGFSLTASADYGNQTITNTFENATVGNEAKGGAFAHFGGTGSATTLVFANNTDSINPDGGNVAVKYVQGTSGCAENTLFWNVGQNAVASYGDCRITFDLYRTSTAYDFRVNHQGIKYAVPNKHEWNYAGIGTFIGFNTGGELNVFGENKGKYKPGLYKMAVDYLKTQNKMVVTLLSGNLNGEDKQNYKLGEKNFVNNDFAAVSSIYFMQNNSKATTSTDPMVDYLDNINRYAADNTWTSDAIADGKVAAGTSAITFKTPRFVDTSTMGNVKLMKNGTDEIGCTVTYANSVTGFTYACDPTFTFASSLDAGNYTLQFNGAKDNYGQSIDDISFTVLGSDDDCSISAVSGGLTLSGDVIGNAVKGTSPSALLANITIPTGAEAVVNGGAYIFGGETITVTSANRNYTKTYSIETKVDLYSYDFNNAKLASELASNEIPNAANRVTSGPTNLLSKAFPNAGLQQFWGIDTNIAGTAHITGAEAAEKSDRVGAISLIDYVNVNTGNIRMSATLYKNTEADKHYAVNVSVKPVKGELTKVFLLKKDHNGDIIGDVQFDDSSKFAVISHNSSISKNNINDWYDITFDYTYNSADKKYTVKSFVNGEYVTVRETSAETYDAGIGMGLEFYVPIKTEAVTKSMYFDNLSAYECAEMPSNACPNNTFVPTVSASDVWLANTAGRISVLNKNAEDIISGITAPSGADVSVVKPDGMPRNGRTETGDRLVIKENENIRTYYIDCGAWSKDAETKTVAYRLPKDINTGKWILGVYGQDNTFKAAVIDPTENGNMVYTEDDNNDYKVFLWNNISNMAPIASPAEYISR